MRHIPMFILICTIISLFVLTGTISSNYKKCSIALDEWHSAAIEHRLILEDWQTNYWLIKKEP